MNELLLSREDFREQTLALLNGTCCICGDPAVDAHHILNRNLWTGEQEGGYYLSNGAPLCGTCHYEAEITKISVKDLRIALDQRDWSLPVGFHKGNDYDAWGNKIVNPFRRIAGPLAHDEGCQKALQAAGVAWQLTET